jgi:HEPN domain-containing protein
MIDIDKQIVYWRDGSREDWEFAADTVERGKTRPGLFFAHLALEKALKALVVRHTRDLAPKVHNLSRLAALAGLNLSEGQANVLSDMNAYNIESRYPEFMVQPPSIEAALTDIARAREVYEWLMRQL